MNFRRSRKSHGYVLLITLSLLVLAATLLVAVGRAAVDHALEARIDQDRLQRQWGIISCRRAILPVAEQILTSNEETNLRPAARFAATIRLGGDEFNLVVADEQAKANVNGLLEQVPVSVAEDRIRDALTGSGMQNRVRLRPSILHNVAITGPGQIFDNVSPDELIGQRHDAPLDTLTCWGGGALNIMRADEPAMRLALMPAFTRLQVARIATARDKIMSIPRTSYLSDAGVSSDHSADWASSLLQQAQIDPKDRGKVSIGSQSNCHSLWIIVNDHRRAWYSLSVEDDSNSKLPRTETVEW